MTRITKKLTAEPARMAGQLIPPRDGSLPLWDIYQNGCRVGCEYADSEEAALFMYLERYAD